MGKLICPRCGDATAPTPLVFKAKVLLEQRNLALLLPSYPYMEGMSEAVTYDDYGEPMCGIMACQSCQRWFVAEMVEGEWSAVYPIQHKPVAEKIPPPIHSEFEEANLCFAIGAYKACVSMCVTALEALWQEQNASGLNDLKGKGIISQRLFDQATEIRLWADIVKHELIHETVTKEETQELLTYLEEILHYVNVRPARSAALAKKREQVEKGDKSKASPSGSK